VLGAVSVTGTTMQLRSEDTERVVLACKSAAARISAVAVDLA
jgi:hypothetical protein